MLQLGANFAKSTSGATTHLFALMLVPLLGITAAAIEYGRAYHAQSDMQRALDAAVMAGAKAGAGKELSVAQATYARNIEAANASTPSFSVAQNGTVSGTATKVVSARLAKVLGRDNITVNVSSEARIVQTTTSTPGGNGVCALVRDASASQALLVNSGAQVNAPKCQIHVASTGNPAAILNSGSNLSTNQICIKGTNIIDNGGVHPNLAKGCNTVADPFAGKLPVPASGTCTYSNLNFNGGKVVLQPGVYCGWINFNSNTDVELKPGLYVIKGGGWNVNQGSWYGKDVSFYFADTSKIQFNSAIASDLSAPTTGTYAGILFFEAEGLPRSNFVFNDSLSSNLDGLWYLPSRDMIFNSDSKSNSSRLYMVFNTLILDQTRWNLEPAELSQYGVTTATTVSETAVVLTK